ncbi:hypothetical protein Taro_032128 [Colocasia esculenta]|uniref:Uncharacterized protein n=1 Tax=Colocasia esculenta TaxID=4460 RepID=A0A843W579_COLES|nr:hypothetical protein [Colocasia esculenta]
MSSPPPLRLPSPLLLCTLMLLPLLRFSGRTPPGLPLVVAARHNVVSHLPGFHGPLPFHLETGYVGQGDGDEVQLFYYFVPSERDPAEDPLLLWLTGGPGCSSLCALADEIGPVKFNKVRYDGTLPTLELNIYSWTKVANIIFLDSPVGAGFSFSRNPEAYNVGDLSASEQVHKFMRKWLDAHPQFISNPFYVGGDSYSGKVVPVVAHFISEGIRGGDKPLINLKGYLVGNPLTGERIDKFSRVPFLYYMGIISEEIYELTVKHCEGQDYDYPETTECAKNLRVVKKFLSEINAASTLENWCALTSPRPKSMKGDRRSLEDYSGRRHFLLPVPEVECREYNFYLIYQWANNATARKALHVQELDASYVSFISLIFQLIKDGLQGSVVGEWERCSNEVTSHYTQDVKSSVVYHLNLTSGGYRALVYSGDHDAIMPYIGTEAWIRTLNYSIVDRWRSWHVDGQVAGYTRSYANNLTFATVKGAGHTAPEFKPKECLAMFQRWISHNSLYVGVDEQEEVHLFYYFVQSERDPSGNPLLLWLNGGACSGLSGLAFEIGNMISSTSSVVVGKNPLYKPCKVTMVEEIVNCNHELQNDGQGTVGEWQRCNHDIHYIEEINSVVPYHFTLTSRGYRALVCR